MPRGGAEVEQFRSDKSGLSLEARRKRSFLGQKGYILLTDLAHNLLSDFYLRALVGTQFEGFGPKRIVRDLLAIPGMLIFDGGQLVRVELLTQKQFARGPGYLFGKVLFRRLKPSRNGLCLRYRVEMPSVCAKIR